MNTDVVHSHYQAIFLTLDFKHFHSGFCVDSAHSFETTSHFSCLHGYSLPDVIKITATHLVWQLLSMHVFLTSAVYRKRKQCHLVTIRTKLPEFPSYALKQYSTKIFLNQKLSNTCSLKNTGKLLAVASYSLNIHN